MNIAQDQIVMETEGRSTLNITSLIQNVVAESSIQMGLCHLFIHHTSASLIITENTDSDVRHDMEIIFQRLAPDADPAYRHTLEGSDDMSAHIRTVLTQTEMTIPVTDGALALGTWQGIFLWEHREGAFQRKLTATVTGL